MDTAGNPRTGWRRFSLIIWAAQDLFFRAAHETSNLTPSRSAKLPARRSRREGRFPRSKYTNDHNSESNYDEVIMWKRILLIGALLACVSSFTRSVRHETRAEDEPLAPAVRSNRNATEEPVLDEAYTDCGLAARVAILLQEEIGWNEFGADHVIDPEIQKMTRHTIFERQRLLRNIRSFAPDATRNGYVNTNAKDARDIAAPIASAQPGRSLSHSSAMKNGKHQEPEVDRLARFTPLDRASAWAAAMASYRGAVAAALRKNAGLQSPMINPPSDNLITNPAGILPGNSEGGSLNPPVAGIQAPGANSAAAIGVGGLGQVAAGTGVGSNAAVGAGSLGGINPTATGTARSASTGGLLSGPAAGAN
ncbi:MAG: hypothetical protein JWN70_4987, partial [Planctomycetaceae bacterium]|nr:hypothetical protein [Planctomycetaceae bacterium]